MLQFGHITGNPTVPRPAPSPRRAQSQFVEQIQQICLTGKSPKSLSSASRKNILIFRNLKSDYIPCIPFHSEGRFANVTNVGMGCGGPWRRARRAMPKRTVKSYGPDILDAGIKSAVIPAGDGGTVIAGETTEQPYKPLRGDAGCFRCDRGALCACSCRGRIGARYPRAL